MRKKLFYSPIILSILFFSCQVDEGNNHSRDNSAKGRKIEYLKGSAAESAKKKIEGKLFNNSLNSKSDSEITISYDEILLITDSLGVKNYTYRANVPESTSDEFYNVVLTETGIASSIRLVHYKMSESFATAYNNGEKRISQFSGKITFTSVDILPQKSARAGDPILIPIDCDEEVIIIPENPSPNPNPGGSGNPGNQNPIGGVGDGGEDEEITMPDSSSCWVWDEQICGMNTPGHYGNDPACNASFQGATFLRNRCNGESIQLYRTMVPYEDPCNPLGEIGVLEPVTELEKCIELKKLTDNAVIKTSLHQLKMNIDQNHEKAFTYARGTNPPVLAFPQINATGNTAKLRILTTTFGIGHIHQKGTASNPSKNWEMFSIADIQGIYKILQSYDDTPDGMPPLNKKMFFNMMMVEGYTYCVFPNDAAAFKNLGSIFGDKDKVKDLEKKLKDLYTNKGKKEYNELTQRDLAQHFLRFINNVFGESEQTNMNMSLYRISNNNDFTGNWEKLELDPNNNFNLKEPIPCN